MTEAEQRAQLSSSITGALDELGASRFFGALENQGLLVDEVNDILQVWRRSAPPIEDIVGKIDCILEITQCSLESSEKIEAFTQAAFDLEQVQSTAEKLRYLTALRDNLPPTQNSAYQALCNPEILTLIPNEDYQNTLQLLLQLNVFFIDEVGMNYITRLGKISLALVETLNEKYDELYAVTEELSLVYFESMSDDILSACAIKESLSFEVGSPTQPHTKPEVSLESQDNEKSKLKLANEPQSNEKSKLKLAIHLIFDTDTITYEYFVTTTGEDVGVNLSRVELDEILAALNQKLALLKNPQNDAYGIYFRSFLNNANLVNHPLDSTKIIKSENQFLSELGPVDFTAAEIDPTTVAQLHELRCALEAEFISNLVDPGQLFEASSGSDNSDVGEQDALLEKASDKLINFSNLGFSKELIPLLAQLDSKLWLKDGLSDMFNHSIPEAETLIELMQKQGAEEQETASLCESYKNLSSNKEDSKKFGAVLTIRKIAKDFVSTLSLKDKYRLALDSEKNNDVILLINEYGDELKIPKSLEGHWNDIKSLDDVWFSEEGIALLAESLIEILNLNKTWHSNEKFTTLSNLTAKGIKENKDLLNSITKLNLSYEQINKILQLPVKIRELIQQADSGWRSSWLLDSQYKLIESLHEKNYLFELCKKTQSEYWNANIQALALDACLQYLVDIDNNWWFEPKNFELLSTLNYSAITKEKAPCLSKLAMKLAHKDPLNRLLALPRDFFSSLIDTKWLDISSERIGKNLDFLVRVNLADVTQEEYQWLSSIEPDWFDFFSGSDYNLRHVAGAARSSIQSPCNNKEGFIKFHESLNIFDERLQIINALVEYDSTKTASTKILKALKIGVEIPNYLFIKNAEDQTLLHSLIKLEPEKITASSIKNPSQIILQLPEKELAVIFHKIVQPLIKSCKDNELTIFRTLEEAIKNEILKRARKLGGHSMASFLKKNNFLDDLMDRLTLAELRFAEHFLDQDKNEVRRKTQEGNFTAIYYEAYEQQDEHGSKQKLTALSKAKFEADILNPEIKNVVSQVGVVPREIKVAENGIKQAEKSLDLLFSKDGEFKSYLSEKKATYNSKAEKYAHTISVKIATPLNSSFDNQKIDLINQFYQIKSSNEANFEKLNAYKTVLNDYFVDNDLISKRTSIFQMSGTPSFYCNSHVPLDKELYGILGHLKQASKNLTKLGEESKTFLNSDNLGLLKGDKLYSYLDVTTLKSMLEADDLGGVKSLYMHWRPWELTKKIDGKTVEDYLNVQAPQQEKPKQERRRVARKASSVIHKRNLITAHRESFSLIIPRGIEQPEGRMLEEDDLIAGMLFIENYVTQLNSDANNNLEGLPIHFIYPSGSEKTNANFFGMDHYLERALSERKEQVALGICMIRGHYIAYMIYENANSQFSIITFDSLGYSHKVGASALLMDFHKRLHAIFPEAVIQDARVKQQLNGTECGVISLQNLLDVSDALYNKAVKNPVAIVRNGQINLDPTKFTLYGNKYAQNPIAFILKALEIRKKWEENLSTIKEIKYLVGGGDVLMEYNSKSSEVLQSLLTIENAIQTAVSGSLRTTLEGFYANKSDYEDKDFWRILFAMLKGNKNLNCLTKINLPEFIKDNQVRTQLTQIFLAKKEAPRETKDGDKSSKPEETLVDKLKERGHQIDESTKLINFTSDLDAFSRKPIILSEKGYIFASDEVYLLKYFLQHRKLLLPSDRRKGAHIKLSESDRKSLCDQNETIGIVLNFIHKFPTDAIHRIENFNLATCSLSRENLVLIHEGNEGKVALNAEEMVSALAKGEKIPHPIWDRDLANEEIREASQYALVHKKLIAILNGKNRRNTKLPPNTLIKNILNFRELLSANEEDVILLKGYVYSSRDILSRFEDARIPFANYNKALDDETVSLSDRLEKSKEFANKLQWELETLKLEKKDLKNLSLSLLDGALTDLFLTSDGWLLSIKDLVENLFRGFRINPHSLEALRNCDIRRLDEIALVTQFVREAMQRHNLNPHQFDVVFSSMFKFYENNAKSFTLSALPSKPSLLNNQLTDPFSKRVLGDEQILAYARGYNKRNFLMEIIKSPGFFKLSKEDYKDQVFSLLVEKLEQFDDLQNTNLVPGDAAKLKDKFEELKKRPYSVAEINSILLDPQVLANYRIPYFFTLNSGDVLPVAQILYAFLDHDLPKLSDGSYLSQEEIHRFIMLPEPSCPYLFNLLCDLNIIKIKTFLMGGSIHEIDSREFIFIKSGYFFSERELLEMIKQQKRIYNPYTMAAFDDFDKNLVMSHTPIVAELESLQSAVVNKSVDEDFFNELSALAKGLLHNKESNIQDYDKDEMRVAKLGEAAFIKFRTYWETLLEIQKEQYNSLSFERYTRNSNSPSSDGIKTFGTVFADLESNTTCFHGHGLDLAKLCIDLDPSFTTEAFDPYHKNIVDAWKVVNRNKGLTTCKVVPNKIDPLSEFLTQVDELLKKVAQDNDGGFQRYQAIHARFSTKQPDSKETPPFVFFQSNPMGTNDIVALRKELIELKNLSYLTSSIFTSHDTKQITKHCQEVLRLLHSERPGFIERRHRGQFDDIVSTFVTNFRGYGC